MPAFLSRRIRRLLLPVDVAALIVFAVLFALVAVVSALAAPLTPRRRILRISAFALSYCLVELTALAAAGFIWLRFALPTRRKPDGSKTGGRREWTVANQSLLGWALGLVLRAGHRCLGFQVAVVGSSDTTPLSGTDPVLVLARHGGPGDSFALVHLLLTRYGRSVRIVLKDILQLDPLVDVLLNRLGCCFLASPSGDGSEMCAQVVAMATQLSPCEALLLFPEGANWTPPRRLRAIDRLRRDHKAESARAADLMTNVLPPRPGGVLACLDARPDLPVVVVAHAGLDRIVTAGQAWSQIPITTPMTVRAWPTADVPPGEDARLAWLTLEWAVVDEWVDAFHAGALSQSN
jgi:1-acyl-sn-glycerol-3-phosphate acyltransferase